MKRNSTNKDQQAAENKSEQKQKQEMEVCMFLWTQKGGKFPYVTGRCGTGEDSFKVVGFFNNKKKNPKEPDLRIYESFEKGHSKDAVASLWIRESKQGLSYYTGADNESKRLVAFRNLNPKTEKSPSIIVYYENEKE